MNRATLAELQRQIAYPSVSVLLNTTPGARFTDVERATVERLLGEARHRLVGDVGEEAAEALTAVLEGLVAQHQMKPASQALALFASPGFSASVRLGRPVVDRVTIDDTFTTRDLVADLNRTALYRVVALSDRMVRMFVGDRQRLVEQRDGLWPLIRTDDYSPSTWKAQVAAQLKAEHAEHPVPCVYAGVQRSVRTLAPEGLEPIGVIAGNHDRAMASQLHTAAWPIVSDWLRSDTSRAMRQLETARSTNRYAGGIHEIWPLASEGRVDTIVVEAGYAMAAIVDGQNQLQPAEDPHAREAHDDIVDDTIELVLVHGGHAVIVDDGTLADQHRMAATLRY